MKYLLTFLAGIVLLIASGYGYGEDRMGGYTYGGDKMITNDDLKNATPDSDSSTFNQAPSPQGTEGSSPGGASSDSDSMTRDSDRGKEPVDKTPMEPAKERDSGHSGTDMYRPGY